VKIFYSLLWRVALVVLVLFIGKTYFQDNFTNELKERETVAEGYVSAMRAVVEKTGDEQAVRDLKFLEEKMLITVPKDGGVQYDERRDYEKALKIVPLIASDKKYPQWKTFLEDNETGAMFGDESKAIILKDVLHFSPVYKGIAMAHETDHAWNSFANPGRVLNPEVIIREEVAEFTFHNRLLLKAGGEAYKAILLEEIARVQGSMNKLSSEEKRIALPDPLYNEKLDEIFGPPLSPEEKDFRAVTLLIDAVFRILDTAGPAKAEPAKIEFIKTWYGSVHPVPEK